jgi:hypothetical protein
VITLTHTDGKLLLAMTVDKMSMELGSLIPESKTRFFNEDDPRNTYIFSTDAQGRLQSAIEDEDGKVGQPTPKLDQKK